MSVVWLVVKAKLLCLGDIFDLREDAVQILKVNTEKRQTFGKVMTEMMGQVRMNLAVGKKYTMSARVLRICKC